MTPRVRPRAGSRAPPRAASGRVRASVQGTRRDRVDTQWWGWWGTSLVLPLSDNQPRDHVAAIQLSRINPTIRTTVLSGRNIPAATSSRAYISSPCGAPRPGVSGTVMAMPHPMLPSAFEVAEEARFEAEARAELQAEARARARSQARLQARGPLRILPTCSRDHLKDWSEAQDRWLCLVCRNIRKRERRGWPPRPTVSHLGESVSVRQRR
jgi:hypothetical protein